MAVVAPGIAEALIATAAGLAAAIPAVIFYNYFFPRSTLSAWRWITSRRNSSTLSSGSILSATDLNGKTWSGADHGIQYRKTTWRPPMAEINVTPLVDVMLVLLIIFMVTAPMLQEGITVDLPAASGAPLQENPNQKDIIISVDNKGAIYIDDVEVQEKELVARTLAKIKENPRAQCLFACRLRCHIRSRGACHGSSSGRRCN